jgi:class 3 adenylate cyclase/tetratricopeptide (TPR) repeat protein
VTSTDERPTSTLASYLPQAVLRRLATLPGPPSEPHADRFPAALLMIDITGFTPITDAAARRGPAGTEQLSRSLNAYLGEIIDLVVEHGGDIAKIVGDALIPIWPATGEDLPTVARRAAACGLAVATRLGEAEMEAGMRLSMKVGLCAGEVAATHVGGFEGRWLFLIAGGAVTQLADLQAQLQTGEVTASPQAWDLIADRFVGQPVGEGHVRLGGSTAELPLRALVPVRLSPDQEAAARAYIPPVLLARIDAGQADWLAELRRTTVAFVNVGGLAGPTREALATLATLAEAGQRVLARYDGWFKDITADDKGTTLIGVFGVPPFTHEDDPARAVDAALDIALELGRLGLSAGVGIATGPTFCGPVGNARRRDFAMLGAHVNLAARLMQAAGEDAVLTDAATRQAAQARHAFERLPPHVLKGLAEPVEVYRARTAARVIDRPVSLVDRTDEMAIAMRSLESLEAGRGALLLLEGEPGIGKSRLVAEWLQRARERGVTSLLGAASEVELATPYHAWRRVFDRLLGVEGVTDQAARRALLLERLRPDPEALRLAPLLAQVLSVDLPDNEVTSQLVGAVRADNTGDLLVRLLRAEAARGPVMVVLEDGHWFDSASWSLVERARREMPELLLVVTTRPVAEDHPGSPAALEAPVDLVRLGVLSRADAVSLAAQRTGASRVDDVVATVVQERAEGNPLFIEQLTYAMRDAGRIVVDHGLLRTVPGVEELERSLIPDTVQRVITARLDQLPPAQALVLKVASVIGPRFPLRTLAEIYPLPSEAAGLDEHLEALTRLDLIAMSEPSAEPTWEFRHKITQEVAYNLMPGAQSRQLHMALAEWYERAYATDPSPFHAVLAHHWAQADMPARAVDHLELAGAQALRTFANEEAIGFLERALSLDAAAASRADPRRRARWHLGLGEAYVHLSRYREGRHHLELGLRLLGQPVPARRWRQATAVLGQALRQVLHRIGLSRSGGHRSDAQRDELVAVCRAYEQLAEASYYGTELLLPLYCVIRILNEAEVSGSAPEIARGLAGTGALFGLVPLPRVAEWYLRRALARLGEVDDLATHEIVGIVVGFYYAGAGMWEPARERFSTVRGIATRLGDRRRLQDAVGNLSEVEYLRGSFGAAAGLADELLATARARGDRRFEGEALVVRAYCAWQLGKTDDALQALAMLRIIASEEPDLPDELRIKLRGIEALTHLGRGERAAAIASSDEAIRLTAAQRPTYGTFLGYAGAAEVYLELWETEQPVHDAEGRANEALRSLGAYARVFPIGRARHATLEGRRAWLRGRHGEALRRWRSALATAEALAMPYESGVAHYELGRHLPPSDTDRATHLQAAHEIFEALGAAPAVRRVEAATAG